MPAGRPPKYTSAAVMQADIDAYFATCDSDNPPLISGLAYALDMTTESLRNYAAQDEYSATIKKAKQRVEMSFEKNLNGGACVGSIFWLKNNAGWKDKSEQELSGSVDVRAIERTIVDPAKG
jgi:hypothetical protein